MIVVADSGATKTDWRIIDGSDKVVNFETIGLSPYFNTESDFLSALTHNFPTSIDQNSVSAVYFYGSGCGVQERGEAVANYLKLFFSNAKVSAQSDALGAARALFGNSPGVVIILGTGSNITYYNGIGLESKTPSLGYALGDEGSGAYMGRLLLRSFLYGYLPKELSGKLPLTYNVDLSHILNMTYSSPRPSAYLASFVPFLVENISHPTISEIVDEALEAMYKHHLAVFPNLSELPVGVIGSVGCLFGERLNLIAASKGFAITKYLRYPIEHLVKYHAKF
ncbi:ATPase [Tenuifilaceae bacterium CYCD]|nr:ATPase [Tenuifilaceae bacterium CYCD]